MPDLDSNLIISHASVIGNHLANVFPSVMSDGAQLIPANAVTPVADVITLVVAEILQAWLNAGSERDVTLEELGPAIEAHVRDWSA
jgi:galactitol-specific phosphotransferase system IIC component